MKDMRPLPTLLRISAVVLFFACAHPLMAWASPLSTDTLHSAPAKANTRVLRGDVNDDGSRSVGDITLMVQSILLGGSVDFDRSLGDMDNDGAISVNDVMILVDIILGAHYVDYEHPDLYIDGAEGADPATGF